MRHIEKKTKEEENEMVINPVENVAAIKKLLSETYGGLVMSHNACRICGYVF